MKQLLVLSSFFIGSIVFAESSQSTKIYDPYSSIRALGMGNAFTAVADDYSLIMYNPAGFAKKKHNELQITLVGAGLAAKTLSIATDIQKASETAGTDNDKAIAISNVLDQYYGKTLGGKAQALEIFWVRKNWGVAVLPMDLNLDLTINKQLGPSLDLNVIGDSTVAFGYGKEFAKNFDAGLTAKYIHRISASEIIPALELASNPNVLSTSRFKEGTALDIDLGFMWAPFFEKTEIKSTDAPQVINMDSAVDPSVVAEVKSTDPTTVNVDEKNKTEQKTENRTPQAEEVKTAEAAITETKVDEKSIDASILNIDSKEPSPVPVEDTNKAIEERIAAEKKKINDENEAAQVKKAELFKMQSELDKQTPDFTVGAVVHNLLESSFSLSKQINKDAVSTPSNLKRVIDIGAQYKLYNGQDFTIRSMLDFKNLLHPQITVNKSVHAGLEMDYSPNTWFKTQVRAGVNQMYFTAGASVLLGIINIDFATYGEEVGTSSTKVENRVFAGKVGFNF